MSENKRVFINSGLWKGAKGAIAYKGEEDDRNAKGIFCHPFTELLRFMGKAVSEGTAEATSCDGSCDKNGGGKIEDHVHVLPTVRNVKESFDSFQANRPADLAFVERKLDGVAGYVARLAEANPRADFTEAKFLFEKAVKELAALKTAGAKDYKPVVADADAVAEEANAVVLSSLAEEAESLIGSFSEESQKGYEAQISSAVAAGGREGTRQLSHLVTGWKTGAERLANWGKPRSQEGAEEPAPAGNRSNRGTRRQENGWRQNSR